MLTYQLYWPSLKTTPINVDGNTVSHYLFWMASSSLIFLLSDFGNCQCQLTAPVILVTNIAIFALLKLCFGSPG